MMNKTKAKSLLILTIAGFILFNLRAGGTYKVSGLWGISMISLVITGIVIFLAWYYLKDYYLSNLERKRIFVIFIGLLAIYIFPTLSSYNTEATYVIDDIKSNTTISNIDEYAEQYPNAILMVIPKDIDCEFVSVLKYAQTKGFTIGVHGTTHTFPEGLVPGRLREGYYELSKYIEVEAYRPPWYINNIFDWLYFKDEGLAYYSIGHGNYVIHKNVMWFAE